jgi:cytochrome P450
MSSFRLQDIPMARDRTEGFCFVTGAGEVFQAADGSWMLTTAEAVHFALRHPEVFSSAEATQAGSGIPMPFVPVAIDPPAHVKYRRILDPLFAPRVVNAMEDGLRAQVRDLISAFVDKGECDIVADIARLYPTQVFLTFFGMRLADRDQLIDWVEFIIDHSSGLGTTQAGPEVVETSTALLRYLQGYIEEKRKQPGQDVLSSILSLQGDEAWSNEELLGFTFIFTLAGLDTVAAAIGFMMRRLALNPQLRQALVDDTTLVGPVIEEVLRLEPPAPMITRVTTEDVEVSGVHIPAKSPVLLWLGTANREPTRYQHPDEFDLTQADLGHVTFGGGVHRCLGSHLARRELRLVVEEFHKLIPEYEIPPGCDPEVKWPAGTIRLASLPLVFPVHEGSS